MADNKSVEEMLGEVLREIGVLIIVFFPLEQWFGDHQLTWEWATGSAVVSAALITFGVILERKRR